MAEWIRLNPSNLKVTTHVFGSPGGPEAIEGLSPEDIPQDIRGYVAEDGGLVVEFRYLYEADEEHVPLRSPSEAVVPVIGRNSGRLYELRFPREMVGRQLEVSIRPMVAGLTRDRKRQRLRKHYEVAAEAVKGNAAAIQMGF